MFPAAKARRTSITGSAFEDLLRALFPTRRPSDVLILDNLASHQTRRAVPAAVQPERNPANQLRQILPMDDYHERVTVIGDPIRFEVSPFRLADRSPTIVVPLEPGIATDRPRFATGLDRACDSGHYSQFAKYTTNHRRRNAPASLGRRNFEGARGTEMTEATVRALLDADPFEAFTIHMAGKNSYDISRPESVRFSPHGGAVYLHDGDQLRAILSIDHIVCIESIPRPVILPAD